MGREKHRKHRNVSKKVKVRKMTPDHIYANSSNGKKLKRSKKLKSELKESVTRGGFKNNLETIFVGIHWRRGDHLSYEKFRNDVVLDEDYFLEAMELYREHYGDVVFVYISDDLQWGKNRLEKKANTRNMEIYFAGDDFDSVLKDRNRDSIGHDLALMALCNHTILSHGTFSY